MNKTLKNLMQAAVLGIALALPSAGKAEDNKAQIPASVPEKIQFDAPAARLKPFGFIDTRFADSYNPTVGFKIGKSWVNQTLVVSGLESVVKEGDALSAFTWLNTDFGYDIPSTEALVEQDFGVNYDVPLLKIENGPKLFQGKLTLNLSGQYWKYWGGQLGEHDWVLDSGLTWNGALDLKVSNRHLFPHTGVQEGNYIYLEASKRFDLKELSRKAGFESNSYFLRPSNEDYSFALTPILNSTWSDNFFQPDDGWTVAQTLLRFDMSKGKSTFYVAGGYQFNIDGDKVNKPDKPIFYIGFTRSF